MFVPLGAGLGPESLIPGGTLGTSPPRLQERSRSAENSAAESTDKRSRGLNTASPLDLSKSPDSNHMAQTSDSDEAMILPDQRQLPPLRRLSLAKEVLPSELSSSSLRDQQRDIEAQLHFLKAKQLEFIKGHQQQAAMNAAAAAAAAVAQASHSRCEECNINFSKYQNYMAHKKYYCSSAASKATGTGTGVSVPVLSDDEDSNNTNNTNTKSDDGKSQNRKPSPPMGSPGNMMGSSPKLQDRKEGNL